MPVNLERTEIKFLTEIDGADRAAPWKPRDSADVSHRQVPCFTSCDDRISVMRTSGLLSFALCWFAELGLEYSVKSEDNHMKPLYERSRYDGILVSEP